MKQKCGPHNVGPHILYPRWVRTLVGVKFVAQGQTNRLFYYVLLYALHPQPWKVELETMHCNGGQTIKWICGEVQQAE